MSEPKMNFSADIAESYDRYLGPMYFDSYARDIADRLKPLEPASILETAAGTGILTGHVRAALGSDVSIVVTDLKEEMLSLARRKFGDTRNTEFAALDACELPYPDESFDAVVCQFGLMFFPDKIQALREARRTLKPGGALITNVWDSVEHNDLVRVMTDAIVDIYPHIAGKINLSPFEWHDVAEIARTFEAAGFTDSDIDTVTKETPCESTEIVYQGLIVGSPIGAELKELDGIEMDKVEVATKEAVNAAFGDPPSGVKMQAHVITARA